MFARLPFDNQTPVQLNQGESQCESHPGEIKMIIALLTIPFAIIAIAIAIVPLVVGMKYQREYEVLVESTPVATDAEASVETPKLELAA